MTNWREVQERPERSTLEILREAKRLIDVMKADLIVCSPHYDAAIYDSCIRAAAGNDYAKVYACLREHGGDIDAAIRELEGNDEQ